MGKQQRRLPAQGMVPLPGSGGQPDLVTEIAAQIFARSFVENIHKTPEHFAAMALDAAEVFVAEAENRGRTTAQNL